MRAIILLLLSVFSFSAFSFDSSRYKSTTLDDLVSRSKTMVEDHNHTNGIEVVVPPNAYIIPVTLNKMPYQCETKWLMFSLKALNYGGIGTPQNSLPPIHTCIEVKSDSGAIVQSFIQDKVAEYIPKEVKIGQVFTLYVIWAYVLDDEKFPGLLITEFDSK